MQLAILALGQPDNSPVVDSASRGIRYASAGCNFSDICHNLTTVTQLLPVCYNCYRLKRAGCPINDLSLHCHDPKCPFRTRSCLTMRLHCRGSWSRCGQAEEGCRHSFLSTSKQKQWKRYRGVDS